MTTLLGPAPASDRSRLASGVGGGTHQRPAARMSSSCASSRGSTDDAVGPSRRREFFGFAGFRLQPGSGPPAAAMTSPAAPAARRTNTVLRCRSRSRSAAPARTADCHASLSAISSGRGAEDRTDSCGPGPPRNALACAWSVSPTDVRGRPNSRRRHIRERAMSGVGRRGRSVSWTGAAPRIRGRPTGGDNSFSCNAVAASRVTPSSGSWRMSLWWRPTILVVTIRRRLRTGCGRPNLLICPIATV
jgi:hypothetical protein